MSAKGADSGVKSGEVVSLAGVGQREGDGKRRQLAECEERIEQARRAAFTVVGGALDEIRDGRLYLLVPGVRTFEDYCEKRWDMGRAHAYRLIEAAQVVRQLELVSNGDKLKLPDDLRLLPAAESHARALAAVRLELRAGVWERVVQETGGRPTAKAVELAGRELTAAYDAARPVTAEEKAVHAAAYEAARTAGGGLPAYDRAGREAVMAYRREHPAPVTGTGRGEEPVSADSTTNGSSRREDSRPSEAARAANWPDPEPGPEPEPEPEPGPDPEPDPVQDTGGPVSGSMRTGGTDTATGTASAATTAGPGPEPKPCDHSAGHDLVCRKCGQKDKATMGMVENIEAGWRTKVTALEEKVRELEAAACPHGALWHEQAEWLHALVAGKGWAWDGRQFAKPPPASGSGT